MYGAEEGEKTEKWLNRQIPEIRIKLSACKRLVTHREEVAWQNTSVSGSFPQELSLPQLPSFTGSLV